MEAIFENSAEIPVSPHRDQHQAVKRSRANFGTLR